MRRKDREITAVQDIADILTRCDTLRLALHDMPYPYIVPLSFGMQLKSDVITLYIHGAKQGKKHTLLSQDSNVCIEADILHRYAQKGTDIFAVYESVIAYGSAQLVHGESAQKGLALLLAHCHYDSLAVSDTSLDALAIYQITLHHVTGKRCIV